MRSGLFLIAACIWAASPLRAQMATGVPESAGPALEGYSIRPGEEYERFVELQVERLDADNLAQGLESILSLKPAGDPGLSAIVRDLGASLCGSVAARARLEQAGLSPRVGRLVDARIAQVRAAAPASSRLTALLEGSRPPEEPLRVRVSNGALEELRALHAMLRNPKQAEELLSGYEGDEEERRSMAAAWVAGAAERGIRPFGTTGWKEHLEALPEGSPEGRRFEREWANFKHIARTAAHRPEIFASAPQLGVYLCDGIEKLRFASGAFHALEERLQARGRRLIRDVQTALVEAAVAAEALLDARSPTLEKSQQKALVKAVHVEFVLPQAWEAVRFAFRSLLSKLPQEEVRAWDDLLRFMGAPTMGPRGIKRAALKTGKALAWLVAFPLLLASGAVMWVLSAGLPSPKPSKPEEEGPWHEGIEPEIAAEIEDSLRPRRIEARSSTESMEEQAADVANADQKASGG